MIRSDTRAVGRMLDVAWCDLSVTKAKGSVTYPIIVLPTEHFALGWLIQSPFKKLDKKRNMKQVKKRISS